MEEPSHTAGQRVVARRRGTGGPDTDPELRAGLARSLWSGCAVQLHRTQDWCRTTEDSGPWWASSSLEATFCL